MVHFKCLISSSKMTMTCENTQRRATSFSVKWINCQRSPFLTLIPNFDGLLLTIRGPQFCIKTAILANSTDRCLRQERRIYFCYWTSLVNYIVRNVKSPIAFSSFYQERHLSWANTWLYIYIWALMYIICAGSWPVFSFSMLLVPVDLKNILTLWKEAVTWTMYNRHNEKCGCDLQLGWHLMVEQLEKW